MKIDNIFNEIRDLKDKKLFVVENCGGNYAEWSKAAHESGAIMWSSEKYTQFIIEKLYERKDRYEAIKEEIKDSDIFSLLYMEFMSQKPTTIQELNSIITKLIESGKQIVLICREEKMPEDIMDAVCEVVEKNEFLRLSMT